MLKFAAKPLDSLPPCHGIGYAYVAIKKKKKEGGRTGTSTLGCSDSTTVEANDLLPENKVFERRTTDVHGRNIICGSEISFQGPRSCVVFALYL